MRDEWQPIETAPKDGTEVILFTSHNGCEIVESFDAVQIGYWDEGNSTACIFFRLPSWRCKKIGEPTHWMPLPTPPVQP
mgnify:CR=1 FL=1